MTNLFNTSVTNGETPIDPQKNYFEELVGDDKKFKTPQDLARAKLESDSFIERLKRENEQIRTELNARLTVEQLMDKVTASKETPNQPLGNQPENNGEGGAKTFNEEDIARIVEQRITEKERTRIQESNLNQVRQALTEKFGPDFASQLKQTADSFGVGEEFLNNLAKEQPRAFLALVDREGPKTPQNTQVNLFTPSPSVQTPRTQGFTPTGDRKMSYYEDLKRKDQALYWSPKVQNQMHQDAIKLGDVFFDVNT